MADRSLADRPWRDSSSKIGSTKKEGGDDDTCFLSHSASPASPPSPPPQKRVPQSSIKGILIRSSPSTTPEAPSSPIDHEQILATMQRLNDNLDAANDVEFRLRLDLNTTRQELELALEEKQMRRNSHGQDLFEKTKSLESTVTKLLQVKEINVCLRLKHKEYERSLAVLGASLRLEKKLRNEISVSSRKQAADHQQQMKERDEEMKIMKNELNNVRDMVKAMQSEVEQKNSRMLGSFAVGVGVGLVSFFLPKHFVGR